jgi:uncharacterized protein YjbI with pentapeptide repeats
MEEAYILDQTFENTDFSQFQKGEYENCTFRNCNFEYADLSFFNFNDCEFIGCNLSMAKLLSTAFRDVVFKECKMFGLHFNDCNEFGVSFRFEACLLNNSIFYKTKIKKTLFKNSKLIDVDFAECDLSGSIFENTNLEKADFRTAFNYSINASLNRLKKAKFSLSEVHGLLRNFDIEIDKNS